MAEKCENIVEAVAVGGFTAIFYSLFSLAYVVGKVKASERFAEIIAKSGLKGIVYSLFGFANVVDKLDMLCENKKKK